MHALARRLVAVVSALFLLASCGSESELHAKATPKPAPAIGASHQGDIDVLRAVFVMNDVGSATLSARLVNRRSSAPTSGRRSTP